MAKQEIKAGRGRSILMLLLVFGPASLLVFFALNKCENKFKMLDDFETIGNYSFTTSTGKTITDENMDGNVVIFTTIQGSCPQECAIAINHFNLLIYQKYRKTQRKNSHIKFVSIITDSEGNPIENMSEVEFYLKDEIQGYDPNIWMLVSGDPKQVYNVENNGVNLFEQRDDAAFAGKPYMQAMLLVDKNNHLRWVGKGATERSKTTEMIIREESMIRDFEQQMALLEKQYDKQIKDKSDVSND
ncbi:MAG: SCO family protein [Lishizhenia sp.]